MSTKGVRERGVLKGALPYSEKKREGERMCGGGSTPTLFTQKIYFKYSSFEIEHVSPNHIPRFAEGSFSDLKIKTHHQTIPLVTQP